MDLTSEYQRSLNDPVETRVVAHSSNAQRRLKRLRIVEFTNTPEVIQAPTQYRRHMTGDADLADLENGNALPLLSSMNATLTELTEQLAALNGQMQQVVNTLDAHSQQFADLNGGIASLNGRMNELTLSVAAAVNSNAMTGAAYVFFRFSNANGVIPDLFPRSNAQLMAMTDPELSQLLEAYNVGVPNAFEDRRARARQLIATGK